MSELIPNKNTEITIVTAFFDIGRGNIPKGKGYPGYLTRTTNTYFKYFSNLAKLENEMIIFTSPDLKERIEKIRRGKPTKVIAINLKDKFKHILSKIREIQELDEFKKRISSEQIKNIEYWSNSYVLVNNLKTFFVNKAIREEAKNKKIDPNRQFAWVDFGYVRNVKTLNHSSAWSYNFKENYIHLFSISDISGINSLDDVYSAIFNNKPYIIGGCIVGNQAAWDRFGKIVFDCQKMFIKNNIIDDDQGVYLMSYFRNKDFFQINYLGKDNWFGLFECFNDSPKKSFFRILMDKLSW